MLSFLLIDADFESSRPNVASRGRTPAAKPSLSSLVSNRCSSARNADKFRIYWRSRDRRCGRTETPLPYPVACFDHQVLGLRASKPGGVFSPQWDRVGHFLYESLPCVRMGLDRRHVICLPCVGYLTKVTDNSRLAGYLVVWEGPASRERRSTLLCLRTSTKAVLS